MGVLNVEINGVKVLQGRLSGINIKDFIRPDLLELLSKELKEAEVIHFSIAVGNEEEKRLITLAHLHPKDAENGTITIDVAEDKDMDRIVNVLNSLKEE